MSYSIYWLHEEHHSDPYSEGYIGITKRDPRQRLLEHLDRNDLIPKDCTQTILHHKLTESKASNLEAKYRPHSHIGWNKSPGGLTGGRPTGIYTSGWKQSEESKKRRSISGRGEGNGMFGKKQTEKQKEAVRKANSIPKPHIAEIMKKRKCSCLCCRQILQPNNLTNHYRFKHA